MEEETQPTKFEVSLDQNATGISSETINHNFVRTSSFVMPKTEDPFSKTEIPSFLHFTPLPYGINPITINGRR